MAEVLEFKMTGESLRFIFVSSSFFVGFFKHYFWFLHSFCFGNFSNITVNILSFFRRRCSDIFQISINFVTGSTFKMDPHMLRVVMIMMMMIMIMMMMSPVISKNVISHPTIFNFF